MKSTYSLIIQHYNSFHFFNKFDIIKEIKEEIKLISKNIFINPNENKIKLKDKFEFLSNSDENENIVFSYISLNPKYS